MGGKLLWNYSSIFFQFARENSCDFLLSSGDEKKGWKFEVERLEIPTPISLTPQASICANDEKLMSNSNFLWKRSFIAHVENENLNNLIEFPFFLRIWFLFPKRGSQESPERPIEIQSKSSRRSLKENHHNLRSR